MRDIGQEILGQCLSRILPFGDFDGVVLSAKGLAYRASADVALSVPELEITGRGITMILGPNGAGKSLLVRLMHGLLKPDAGEITFENLPVNGKGRDRQAMVFQKPVLLRRSVTANLKYALKFSDTPRDQRAEKLDALLELSGLKGRENQPARSLSGGEEQCLALACALARGPKMLFLDEPTSSLDPSSTQRIESILLQAAALGVRIVMVSHDIAQAERLADEVLFLCRGKITEYQSAGGFFKSPTSAEAHVFLAGQLLF